MGTQHSSLILSLVDNFSGPGSHVSHKVPELEHDFQHFQHTVKEVGVALGLAFGLKIDRVHQGGDRSTPSRRR
jgi:hypothetical protein